MFFKRLFEEKRQVNQWKTCGESQVLKERKEIPVPRGRKVPKEMPALKERKEILVLGEKKVTPVLKERKVPREIRGTPVPREKKVPKEIPVLKEKRGKGGRQEKPRHQPCTYFLHILQRKRHARRVQICSLIKMA